MGKQDYLTAEDIKTIWTKEFLPSIRREFKLEMESVNVHIKELTDKCQEIEQSQKFLSTKYDKILETLQESKKQSTTLESKIQDQEKDISQLQGTTYEHDCTIDEIQQYLRRDSLEITGIPILPADNPKQLVQEVATLLGEDINESHISTAHRLPATRNVKDRLIVKFIHRDTRELIYKKRRLLKG